MKKISAKKQALIDAKEKEPIQVGEYVYVEEKSLSPYYRGDGTKHKRVLVESIDESDKIIVINRHEKCKISFDSIVSRDILSIGANPFSEEDDTRFVAFSFHSIIFQLDILGTRQADLNRLDSIKFGDITLQECNWNPFIYDENGNKHYYQRPFVWTLKDKQLFIESIYQGIDCGKIVIRKRGYDELKAMSEKGETELFWNDIVDGKQRLKAIQGFIKNEYPDAHGNYYEDLSFLSQNKFENNQLLSYAELPEDSKDEQVIRQFLKMNFSGIPQSQEHIDFVKSLLK